MEAVVAYPAKAPCVEAAAYQHRDTGGLAFTDRIRSTLSPAERQALADAVEQVNDFLLAELVVLYHEDGSAVVTRVFSDQFLPIAKLVDPAGRSQAVIKLTGEGGATWRVSEAIVCPTP